MSGTAGKATTDCCESGFQKTARGSSAAHGTPAHGAGTAAARGPSAAPSTADAPPARQPAHGPGTLDEILYGGIPSDVAAASTSTLVVNLSASIKAQLRLYDSLPGLSSIEEDPLQWWKSRAWQMPHLAMAARDAFGTPGSSHALERAFSSAGRAVDHKRRPRLSRRRGASIIFCHENVQRAVL